MAVRKRGGILLAVPLRSSRLSGGEAVQCERTPLIASAGAGYTTGQRLEYAGLPIGSHPPRHPAT